MHPLILVCQSSTYSLIIDVSSHWMSVILVGWYVFHHSWYHFFVIIHCFISLVQYCIHNFVILWLDVVLSSDLSGIMRLIILILILYCIIPSFRWNYCVHVFPIYNHGLLSYVRVRSEKTWECRIYMGITWTDSYHNLLTNDINTTKVYHTDMRAIVFVAWILFHQYMHDFAINCFAVVWLLVSWCHQRPFYW